MRLATFTALLTLALAGSASADSISFLRGGDIWVGSPDGAKQVQVTHSGVYSYQSQADDGTFIALAGRRLHRLDRSGNVLADFATPVSGDIKAPNDSEFFGPFEPEISPDGSKVVYTYTWTSVYNKPGCEPAGTWICQEKHTYQGVAYSYSDRMTGWDEPGLGNRSGWVYPSWIGNDGIMVSTPSEPLNLDVMYDKLSSGKDEVSDWFTDENAWYTKDGEVSRDGSKVVFVNTKPHGYDDGGFDDRVTIYRMTGPAPATPEQCFSLGDGHINASPSFAPDGSRVAWQRRISNASGTPDTNDVLVGDATVGCAPDAASTPGAVVLNDAAQPDWGPRRCRARPPSRDRPTRSRCPAPRRSRLPMGHSR